MIGMILALLSAMVFGLAVVGVRKSLNESRSREIFDLLFVIVLVGNIVIWPLAVTFTDLRTFTLESILLFALAGLFAPGIGRLLYYKGMVILGTPTNAAIHATSPMFSTMLAVLLINETLFLQNWIGLALIVLGAVMVESKLHDSTEGSVKVLRRALLFPLSAAIVVGFSYVVRKQALSVSNGPLLGAAIGYLCSLLLYVPLLNRESVRQKRMPLRKSVSSFWKASVGLLCGWTLSILALSFEKVTIVTSILQTEPLFILFFSHLYLKESDKISPELILAVLLVVAGVVMTGIK